jgi:hypothetical protein
MIMGAATPAIPAATPFFRKSRRLDESLIFYSCSIDFERGDAGEAEESADDRVLRSAYMLLVGMSSVPWGGISDNMGSSAGR